MKRGATANDVPGVVAGKAARRSEARLASACRTSGAREAISREKLQAELRKLSYDSPQAVKLAVLEDRVLSPVGADDGRPGDNHITAGEAKTCGAASSGMTC